MTILVTGSTGTIGIPLLEALQERDDVRALIRSDADRAQAEQYGATAVIGDLLDPASLHSAFDGVDRLFLLSPFVEGQAALEHAALDAAEKAAVPCIVKLAYAGVEWPIALTAAHREIETRLASSSAHVTLLHADVFAANLLGQATLVQGGQLVLPGAAARIAYVDPADVAAVAAHLLTVDEPVQGTVVVTGPDLLSNDQVATLFGQVVGTDAVYVEATPEPWASSLVEAGWPAFAANAVAEMHTTIADKGPIPVSDATQRLLGRPARPLPDFLTRALSR